MGERHEIRPHHLLRAVLDDRLVREVLAHLQAPADEVRATLDRRWLDTIEELDSETLHALGIDVATVLMVVNPPFDDPPEWRGREITKETRDVLVVALRESAGARDQPVHAGHLLLGLMSARDPLVSATLAAHGLRLREVRALVNRWGRRVR